MFLKNVQSQFAFKASVYRQIFMTAFLIQLIGFLFTFSSSAMAYSNQVYTSYYSTEAMFVLTLFSVVYFAIAIHLQKQREQSLFFITNGKVEWISTYLWVIFYSLLSALLFALAPFTQRVLLPLFSNVYESQHTLTISEQWFEFNTAFFYYLMLGSVFATFTLFLQWKRTYAIIVIAFMGFLFILFNLSGGIQSNQTNVIAEGLLFFNDTILLEPNPWLFGLKCGLLSFFIFLLGLIPATKLEVLN